MMYIDTNVFIYAIENHPEYGQHCKRVLIKIESNEIKACASILVLIEIINVLTKINKILEKNGQKQLDIQK
jgi:predicted nucleic acid-binding protein